MKHVCALGLLVTLPVVAACGGAAVEEKRGGRATVSIDGTTCTVTDVKFAYQPGEHGSFRLEGDGMALRGDLPSGVNSPVELSEKEVPLVGVEHGTVKFGRVFGGAIGFAFSGDFTRYDGRCGTSRATVHASGSGTATIE